MASRLLRPLEILGQVDLQLYRVGSWSLRAEDGRMIFGCFTPPTGARPAEIVVMHGLPPDVERAVIVHEAAHYAVYLATVNPGAHNDAFVAEMTRLARLGAPGAERWARPDTLR